MSAATPLGLEQRAVAETFSPVTLNDMAPLREAYARSIDELDIIESAAASAAAADCMGGAAAELRQAAVRLRLLLQLGASHVEGIAALVRAHNATPATSTRSTAR